MVPWYHGIMVPWLVFSISPGGGWSRIRSLRSNAWGQANSTAEPGSPPTLLSVPSPHGTPPAKGPEESHQVLPPL